MHIGSDTTRHASLGDEVDRPVRLGIVLAGERAAVAAQDVSGEPVAQGGCRDPRKGPGVGARRFIHVEIEIEAAVLCGPHDRIEVFVEPRDHVGDSAEDAVGGLDAVGDASQEAVVGVEPVDAEEAGAVQRNPVRPVRDDLAQDRPRDRVLRRQAVDMGPDQRRSMRVGATQRELHARAHVLGRPVGDAVLRYRLKGAREGSVRVRAPRPDVSLVQMDMAVDKGRQDHAGVEVDGCNGLLERGRGPRCRREQYGRWWSGRRGYRQGQVRWHPVSAGNLPPTPWEPWRWPEGSFRRRSERRNRSRQFSLFSALSCHLRSSR